MKYPGIDEPIRLGGSFWLTYALLLGPSAWLLHPWTWDLPIYAEILGAFFPPFLAAIALCAIILFILSLTADFSGQKRAFAGFIAGILGPAVFLGSAWVFSGYQNLPSICAFVASFIGYSLLYLSYRRDFNRWPRKPAASGSCGRSQ